MMLYDDQDEGPAPQASPLPPQRQQFHSTSSYEVKITKHVSWAANALVYEIPANEVRTSKKSTSGKTSSKRHSSSSSKDLDKIKSRALREHSGHHAAEPQSTAKVQNLSAKAPGKSDASAGANTKGHSHRKRPRNHRSVPPAVPEVPTKDTALKTAKPAFSTTQAPQDPDHRFCACHDEFFGVKGAEQNSPRFSRKTWIPTSADKIELQMQAARNHINNSRSSCEPSPDRYEASRRKEEEDLDFSDRTSLIGRDFILYDDDRDLALDEKYPWPRWD